MELVGRESEVADVLDRLSRRRLVTVTGAGGIGKTALARAVLERHDSAASVVDLTRVDEPGCVEDTIAGQFGFHDLDALIEGWLATGHLCFVDNCEHVLDVAASVIGRMLDGIPGLTVLATSRSPLALPGESLVQLGPLDGESHDRPHSMEVFLAAAVDAGVPVAALDVEVVARICRLLDGVPLALEIAAGRLRTMSPEELADTIESDLARLTRSRFRGRAGHQGVAEMVSGSVALLDDDGRDVFDALGVFAGPFTASAAAAVTDRAVGTVRGDMEDLVAASLVIADTASGTVRYRLLHPVRAVAADRLRRSGELDVVHDRLVDHVVETALHTVSRAHSGWDGAVLGDLLASYQQIVGSVRWALTHDADPSRAFVLLTVLWGVIHQAHAAEVESLGTQALEKWPDPALPGRADVVATVVTARVILGERESVEELATNTLRDVAPGSLAAATLPRALGQLYRGLDRMEEARARFREAAKVAEGLQAGGLAMEAWVAYGMLTAELGDFDGGLSAIESALHRASDTGAELNAAWAQTCRAAVLLLRSPGDALEAAQAALGAARALDYPVGIAASLRVVAMAHLAFGDDAQTAATLLDMLEELRRRGGLTDLRLVLDLVAVMAESRGAPGWADLAVTAAGLPVTSMFSLGDRELAERAGATGAVLALREAHDAARRLLLEFGDEAAPVQSDAASRATLSDRGDTWAIRFGTNAFTIKANKGMSDLARLLAAPGVEMSAVDLMGAVVTVEGADDVLDETARRSYAARVRDLQEEIDEAERFGDFVRGDQAREEMDAIVDHLTAATGIGGRSRRTPTAAERARSAVTHRLRSTIRKIADLDAGLGRHLETFVTTGSFCSYRPDPPVRWTVETRSASSARPPAGSSS